MASAHRRIGSKYFVGAYTDADGVRRQHSTKCTTKIAALAVADGWEKASRLRATTDQAQKILAQIVERVSGDAFERVLAHDYHREWLARKKLELADSTYTKYAAVTKEFMQDVPKRFPLADISASMVATFRDKAAARTSIASGNDARKIVNIMLSEAVQDGKIADHAGKKVRTLRKPVESEEDETTRRPFTLDEFRLVYQGSDTEWQGMELFGLYTGKRLKDIARARGEQIKDGVWRKQTGKTGKVVNTPLAQPVLDWLAEHGVKVGPLFPKSFATPRTGTLSNRFTRILSKVGLRPRRVKRPLGKGRNARRAKNALSFHSLRHTLTSILESLKVSKLLIMEFVGHEDERVSDQYTHVSIDQLSEVAKKLPDVRKS